MISEVNVFTLERLTDRHETCVSSLIDVGVPNSIIKKWYGPDRLDYSDIESIKESAAHEFSEFKYINDDKHIKGYTAQAWGYCKFLKQISEYPTKSNVMLIQDRRMLMQPYQQIEEWVKELVEYDPDYKVLCLIQGENNIIEGTSFCGKKGMGAQDWAQVFNTEKAGIILDGFLDWIKHLGVSPPTYETYLSARNDIYYLKTYCANLLDNIEKYPSALHEEIVIDRYTIKPIRPLV